MDSVDGSTQLTVTVMMTKTINIYLVLTDIGTVSMSHIYYLILTPTTPPPISQIRKLRPRDVKHMPRVLQIFNGRAGTPC